MGELRNTGRFVVSSPGLVTSVGGRIDPLVTLVVVVGLECSDVGTHSLQRVDQVLIRQLPKSLEAGLVLVRGVEAIVADDQFSNSTIDIQFGCSTIPAG